MNGRPRTLLALNWKMNKLPSEAASWARDLRRNTPESPAELVVVPPFVAIGPVAAELKGSEVGVGAQDVSRHPSGAYTGEVSAPMLADAGVAYVVVGHSERRSYHAEGDEIVAAKARAAQEGGLTPIVCVGESLDVREQGRHVAFTLEQLRVSLQGVNGEPARLVVAYEPIWAIGTGRTATAQDAEEMAGAIRGVLRDLYGDAASEIRVLYGGSVKPDNIREICGQANVNGALVGGASLDLASVRGMLSALV